jgi:hypothetical protein
VSVNNIARITLRMFAPPGLLVVHLYLALVVHFHSSLISTI